MSIELSSRWYKAAGASIVAAAVTARYVAKWRRQRSLRRGPGGRTNPGGRYFIGLDLADPYAASPRPCDVAILDSDLRCTFAKWRYNEAGASIVPKAAIGKSFILAVDGPQGLAGRPDAEVRVSERIVRAPGRSPYTLPQEGQPFAGFITGSVRLFHSLVTSGSRFRLVGLEGVATAEANLMEVFPGSAWRVVSGEQLPAKRLVEGRRARQQLLEELGVSFPSSKEPLTADELDAAMAAWTAYCWAIGQARQEGEAPVLDQESGVIREGYIVQPVFTDDESESSDDVDLSAAPV